MARIRAGDIEVKQRPSENLEGYTDFSKFIATDAELSIYRRFDALASRNLLYLQGELQALEVQLQRLDDDDRQELQLLPEDQQKAIRWAAKSWEGLSRQSQQKEGRQKEKMALILKIRENMKDYEDAMLRRSRMLALGSPSRGNLEAFSNWFRRRKPFLGSGWHLLDDEEDLVTLQTDASPDRMTSLIRHFCGYMIRERRHEHPESWGPVYYFPLPRVTWIVSVLSVVISGALLIGAVAVLYNVQGPGRRLAIAGAFTATFTASVGLLTNAKRSEIFTATAAYAAVLVVYLSGPAPEDT